MSKLHSVLDEIVERNRITLHEKIEERRKEMKQNNVEHLRLYELLGFTREEGRKIDLYQNIGRFVYKYAGALIEEASFAVLNQLKGGVAISIDNIISTNPKRFRIDCYVEEDNKAHEIKWRDATTDGDHARKENDKVQCITKAGMIPIRIMYYMPNREQAIRIQHKIMGTYNKHGAAFVGESAWDYIKEYTGFDLYGYLYKKTKSMKI